MSGKQVITSARGELTCVWIYVMLKNPQVKENYKPQAIITSICSVADSTEVLELCIDLVGVFF